MGSLRGSMARGVEAIGMEHYLYLKEVFRWPIDFLKGLLSRFGDGLHLEVLGPRGWLSSKHGELERWGISRGSRPRPCSSMENCSWRFDEARGRLDVDQDRTGTGQRARDNSCGERKRFELLLSRLRVNYWSWKMTLPSSLFDRATRHVIGYFYAAPACSNDRHFQNSPVFKSQALIDLVSVQHHQ